MHLVLVSLSCLVFVSGAYASGQDGADGGDTPAQSDAAGGFGDLQTRPGLAYLDWVVIAVYGTSMIALGWYFSRRQASTEEYFLGGRKMGAFIVGISTYATLLSTIFGVSAALIGGLYEKVVMRVVDAFIVIPMVIVIILVAAYIKPSILTLILLISLLSWQGGARIIRAQALSLKERGHVTAAKSFGAHHLYIAWRHIIPDLGPILLVDFIYSVRRAVFMEAGLAFLGITDPTVVSWGMMMRDALNFSYLDVWQWWLVPTGIALSLTIIGLTFIGHAAEPIIEPRLRGAEIA